MSRFREITTRDLRRLNQAASDLATLPNRDAIERIFIEMAGNLLPGSCICWNNWTLDMRSHLTSTTTASYLSTLSRLNDPLNAIVGHHPLIASGAWLQASHRPQRLSDFQGHGAFKHNPLFHEVYRHLEAHFQLVYNIPAHASGIVCLTWNRLSNDFTERDRDFLHLIGHRLDVIMRRLDERQRLERACAALQSLLPAASSSHKPATLSPAEGRLLAGVAHGHSREVIAARLGWRRDTLDRRLADLRERLGFENNHLLLRSLSVTAPPKNHPRLR